MKEISNKKAFTLVELLAVIVILGILLGVAVTAVSSYINQTRDDTYSLHEANMKVAASNMMSVCEQKDTENCIPESGNSRVIYLSELIDTQYSEKLKDPADTDNYCSEDESYVVVTNVGDGYDNLEYSVCLKCSNYESDECSDISASSSTNSCSNEDNVDPVCGEVVGGSTLWTNEDRVISVGCSDSDCGCSQTKYYKTFTETATTGEITIKDKAGNTTSCTVNVYIDKEEPTCTLSVSGTLGENGWYGGTAPVVTLTSYTDGESGVATYGMGTSKSNYNFDKTTSYTVSTGITTVYGYVKDNAGNVGTCSVEVKYDNAIPTEDTYYGYQVYTKEDMTTSTSSTITIDSNNALKEGSNILSEYGNIYGIYVYPTSDSPGMTITVNGETRTISAGVTTPTYIEFDSAFTGSSLTITVSNSRASYISKIEVVTQSTSGYYTNKNVTLYIHSHDSLSGKAYYSFDNGSTWSTTNYKNYSSNTGSLTLKTKDIAGNVSTGSSMNINNIDKVAPTCTVNFSGTLGNNNWYTDNVTVSLTRSDSDSGVRYYGVSTSGLVYDNSTKTQTADTAGTEWTGYVIDKAGNTATCKATVKKDSVKPECELQLTGTMGDNNWYISNVEVTFKSKTDSLSGMDTYNISTSSTPSYNNNSSKVQTTDTAGITYYGYVKDKAGNTNSCSITFKRDASTPSTPSVTFTKWSDNSGTRPTKGSTTNKGSTISISTSATTWSEKKVYSEPSGGNDTVSGLDHYEYTTTGATTTETNATGSYRNIEAQGESTIKYRACNQAGTCSSYTSSYMVGVDYTAPTCSINTTNTLKVTSQTATLQCTDSTSGMNNYYWGTSSSGTPSTSMTSGTEYSKTVSSANTYYLIAYDNAGNRSSVNKTYYSYIIRTMKQKTTGTATEYTTSNYDTASTSSTYIAPSGTSLTHSSLYSSITGFTYKGYSTGDLSSSTSATLSTSTSTSLSSNIYINYWFARNTYTISYTLNSGTNSSSNPSSYTYGVGVSSFANPSRTGYTFGGWYSDNSFTNKVTSISTTATGDKTLYAKWTANTYTLTYNNQSGSGCTSKTGTYDSTWGSLCTPSRTGYTFNGWYTSTGGSGTHVESSTTVSGDLTVYASWTANTYTLTYKNQSGSGCTSKTGTYGSTWGTLCTPSRTGYTFNGWYTSTGGSGTHVKSSTTVSGNLTVYASWTASCSKTNTSGCTTMYICRSAADDHYESGYTFVHTYPSYSNPYNGENNYAATLNTGDAVKVISTSGDFYYVYRSGGFNSNSLFTEEYGYIKQSCLSTEKPTTSGGWCVYSVCQG